MRTGLSGDRRVGRGQRIEQRFSEIGLDARSFRGRYEVEVSVTRFFNAVTRALGAGLAKDTAATFTLTIAGQLLATPRYMSPEQCIGRPVDSRSDLYSLGAILYEMLTGSKIYDSANSADVIGMHVSAPVPQLAALISEYQPMLDKLLAKAPDDRYQSAAEFLASLPA